MTDINVFDIITVVVKLLYFVMFLHVYNSLVCYRCWYLIIAVAIPTAAHPYTIV